MTDEQPGWALNALDESARKAAAQLDETGVFQPESGATFDCPDCFDARRIRDPQTDEYHPCPNCTQAALGIHRLSVNINDEAADTLRCVTAKRDITTTEAIRWAIGLLDYCEQEANTQNAAALADATAFPEGPAGPLGQRDANSVTEATKTAWGLEDARRIVASIPPLTDAQCDAAALDYAQTRLAEVQAQLEQLADEVDGWQTTGTIPELEAYRRGQRSVAARIRVIARG